MKRKVTLAALVLGIASCGSSSGVDLDVAVTITADVPTIEAGMLRLSLWSFDSNIADLPATLVAVDEVRFTHAQGSRDEVSMHVAGDIEDGRRHYSTVRGCELTATGWIYVLWDGIEGIGTPSEVEMRYIGPSGDCDGIG